MKSTSRAWLPTRFDAESLTSNFLNRAESGGFNGGSHAPRASVASQAGVIAARATTVFQVIFSAVAGRLIAETLDLAYRNAKTFLEEHPKIEREHRVTVEQQWSSVSALPRKEREEFLRAVETSFRDVLMPNMAGAPAGTRPLKSEEAHLLSAFRDLVSNGRDVSAASRILVRQFSRGAVGKADAAKSLLRRVRRLEKRAVDLGLTDTQLRALATAKNKNFKTEK